jgi:fimbrial chaperone protein
MAMGMKLGRSAAACVVLLLGSVKVTAASLGIAPVGLDLPATQKAATVSLVNNASTVLNVQVRVFKWQQLDGKDQLVPTQDVVASPPATSIPPGQTYVVRVARVSQTPVATEESYRLLIDEIPPAIDEAAGKGVSMVLRTSLPVFFGHPDAAPNLGWRVFQKSGNLTVEVANLGKRHVRLSDLAAQSGDMNLKFGSTGYVLPGATRQFSAPLSSKDLAVFSKGAGITLTGRIGPGVLKKPTYVVDE